jgi:protein-L-isoaspartate(D-aspartate) O-methyltransferase
MVNMAVRGFGMSMMADLLGRLRSAGVPLDEVISEAMESVDPADFTDFHLEPFWDDRPVPFLFTDFGATRTISAPHMIVTLLHHLEVREGQHALLIGSKGGYLAALLDHLVGPNGAVTIVEPHREVRMHTEERLEMHDSSGLIRVLPPHALEQQDEMNRSVDRVLITGAVRSIPDGIDHLVYDGGFVLGPFGGPVHQRLIKRERQGNDWFDTDLGGVVFGPMDVGESERGPLDPRSLANHIEDALGLIGGIGDVEEDTVERVEDLVCALREMPPDLPPLDEDSTEEDILEHPVVDLLMSEIDWLGPLWPLFSEYLSLDIANPGSPDEDEPHYLGGHEDIVP